MRFLLDALFKPVDPVVAVHQSRRDADESLAALRRAGYGRGMVTLVGQSGSTMATDGLTAGPRTGLLRWVTSGTCWGLLWAAFTTAAVLVLPAGGSGVSTLLTIGVLGLLLQTAIVAHVVAPERDSAAARPVASPSQTAENNGRQDWRFLVLVRGSRSDIALARAILATH